MKTQLDLVIDSATGKIDYLSSCKEAYLRLGDKARDHNAMVDAIHRVFHDNSKLKTQDLVNQVLLVLKVEPHHFKAMDASIRRYLREFSLMSWNEKVDK